MMILLLCLATDLAQESGGDWQITTEISGMQDGSNYGRSMAAIQDIDGDGTRELVVGDPWADHVLPLVGAAYVYSGRTGALIFSFFGEVSSASFGNDVADAGDVDCDGFHDILVGSESANLQGWWEGAAYVFSGRDGHLIHRLLGNSSGGGNLGATVSGIGDLNLDGCDDFLVGDPDVDPVPGAFGVIWAFSGRDGSVLMPIVVAGDAVGTQVSGIADLTQDGIPDLLAAGNRKVFVLSGADGSEFRRHLHPLPNDGFGSSLAGLGDLDQDSVEDYVIGAPDSFADRRTGRVYVHSGASGALRWEIEGSDVGSDFGGRVTGPGDVDGDGFPDILVGARQENAGPQGIPGAAHLFSGFNGSLLARFINEDPGAKFFGWSVAGAGDVNGDGLMDVAVGSLSSSGGGFENGLVRTYALHSYLNLSSRSVSAAAGATIQFDLDFPDTDAGKDYFLLASGGVPGRTRVLGHWLPLARTPLLDLMAHNPPGFISGAQGTLDGFGNATSTATLAPNQAAAWVGRTIKFVAVSFDAPNDISLYSAAMSLTLKP